MSKYAGSRRGSCRWMVVSCAPCCLARAFSAIEMPAMRRPQVTRICGKSSALLMRGNDVSPACVSGSRGHQRPIRGAKRKSGCGLITMSRKSAQRSHFITAATASDCWRMPVVPSLTHQTDLTALRSLASLRFVHSFRPRLLSASLPIWLLGTPVECKCR